MFISPLKKDFFFLNRGIFFPLLLGLYTVSKVLENISIIKSIAVSERQINDMFSDTFLNDINKHKAILTQK